MDCQRAQRGLSKQSWNAKIPHKDHQEEAAQVPGTHLEVGRARKMLPVGTCGRKKGKRTSENQVHGFDSAVSWGRKEDCGPDQTGR